MADEESWLDNTISRFAVQDTTHFDSLLWKEETMVNIQKEIAIRLRNDESYFGDPFSGSRIRPIFVPIEQIRNVADSISESNPRVGTNEKIEMIISYIVAYLKNEETVNQTPAYDSKVTKYDGSFGIQRMATGQLAIRKKGLNPIGRMF